MQNNKLQPGDIYAEAIKALPAGDIDHHASDLYIRVTPAATAIINRLENKALLSTFRDRNGAIWYELPFCYTPFWGAPNKRGMY